MNRLPWFPECLSLPETGTMVVHIFVFNFWYLKRTYSFVWIGKIATTRTLIVALRYREGKKKKRSRITIRIDFGICIAAHRQEARGLPVRMHQAPTKFFVHLTGNVDVSTLPKLGYRPLCFISGTCFFFPFSECALWRSTDLSLSNLYVTRDRGMAH